MHTIIFKSDDFVVKRMSEDLMELLGYMESDFTQTSDDDSHKVSFLDFMNEEMREVHKKVLKRDPNTNYNKMVNGIKSMKTLNTLPLRRKNNTYCMFCFQGIAKNDENDFVMKLDCVSNKDNIQIPRYFHEYINGSPRHIFIEQYSDTYIMCFDIMNSTELCIEIGSSNIAKVYNDLYQIIHHALYEISYPYIRIHETCGDSVMLIANATFMPQSKKIVELILNTCARVVTLIDATSTISVRCGIAKGDISGGVIDGTSFRIFGSCVHLAARLESHCLENHISCQKEIIDNMMSTHPDFMKKFDANLCTNDLKGFGETSYYDIIACGQETTENDQK